MYFHCHKGLARSDDNMTGTGERKGVRERGGGKMRERCEGEGWREVRAGRKNGTMEKVGIYEHGVMIFFFFSCPGSQTYMTLTKKKCSLFKGSNKLFLYFFC